MRRLQYDYFNLNEVDRFHIVCRMGLVREKEITRLPLSFFISCLEEAKSNGSAQSLWNAVRKAYLIEKREKGNE